MTKYIAIKLLGLALLTMTALVAISFIEVAVYSYAVNPGQAVSVYDAHAEFSAPYVSGIFGFVIFFLVTRYWTKRGYQNVSRLAILFPLTYVLVDVVILISFGVLISFIWIFLLANSAKFLGSYLGYKLTK